MVRHALLAVVVACRTAPTPEPAPRGTPTAQPAVSDAAMQLVSAADAGPTAIEHDHHDDDATSAHVHDECEVSGEQIITAPPLPVAADERDLTKALRRRAVHEACEDKWATEVLAEELAAIDELATNIRSARKKVNTLRCPNVVSGYYADAKWRGKLEGFSASDRKQMITRSRERMTSACSAEAWSDVLRACIVVGGGARCFELYGRRLAWGYPAAGSVTSLGISDCDAYGATLATITSCTKIDTASRDALRRSFDEMQAHLASLPPSERGKLASSCRAGRDAIARVAAHAGC